MKKLILFLALLILILPTFTACGNDDAGVYSSELKLNIKHIDESDETKEIHIAYPVFGGIEDKEAVTIINSSIANYVESEYDEFQAALTTGEQNILGDDTAAEGGDEEEEYADEEENEEEESADNEEGDDGESADGEEPVGKISLDMNFKITYNKRDYLCIVQTYAKDLGKDLQFNGQRSFFFSLDNATYLSLGEIFDFDAGFADHVNAGIKKQLANGAYTTYDDNSGFTGISKNCNFIIDTNHLYIYYDALEISPDKDVIPTFVFPASEVKKYLNDTYDNIF